MTPPLNDSQGNSKMRTCGREKKQLALDDDNKALQESEYNDVFLPLLMLGNDFLTILPLLR